MKKLIVILLIMSGLPVFGQPDKIDSLLNDLVYNDKDPLDIPEKLVKFDFIYTGINFNSNTFYAGREIDTNMYNISGHIFYYHSLGFFIGASGLWFDKRIPSYSLTTLSAGFSKAIDKKKLFTFRTSYSRFLYYQSDSSNEYPYKNNLSLGLSFRKKWIGARASGNLLFGEDYRVNISCGIYSRFTLIKLGKNNKIYTAPELSAFFGTETITTRKTNGQNAEQGTSETKEIYGLLNTQLYVPLGISLGDFDFEFSGSMNIPTTQDTNVTYPVKAFYSATISYMLPVSIKQK
jgi:hypothetical protein